MIQSQVSGNGISVYPDQSAASRAKCTIHVWEKYILSIEEASDYFRIGEGKLRRLIRDDPTADYLLWNGNRAQIKRKKFEAYIDQLEVI